MRLKYGSPLWKAKEWLLKHRLVFSYKLTAAESSMKYAQHNYEQLKKERGESEQELQRILPRLIQGTVAVENNGFGNRYRFIVDLPTTAMEDSLIWGNDDSFLRHIGEYCGHLCYRELKTCNMKRFSEVRDVQMQGYRFKR